MDSSASHRHLTAHRTQLRTRIALAIDRSRAPRGVAMEVGDAQQGSDLDDLAYTFCFNEMPRLHLARLVVAFLLRRNAKTTTLDPSTCWRGSPCSTA